MNNNKSMEWFTLIKLHSNDPNLINFGSNDCSKETLSLNAALTVDCEDNHQDMKRNECSAHIDAPFHIVLIIQTNHSLQ